jgi:nitrous oxidase accessory protein NosD
MHVPLGSRMAAAAALTLSVATVAGVGAAVASAWRSPPTPTLYVNSSILSGYGAGSSPAASRHAGDRQHGHRHGSDPCSSATYAKIGEAVAAATTPGTRIVVCPGTYSGEDVTVNKPVTIEGIQAIVDATGENNGFTLLAAAAGTTIRNFTIENAVGEGVLALSTSDVSIVNNTIQNNDTGVGKAHTYLQCEPSPENPFPDCGEGVHLLGTSSSQVIDNIIRENSGGVLMTDETGPTANNLIGHNRVLDNTLDCGITLAGHNAAGAPGGIPNPTVAGVYGNRIEGNVADRNGVKGQGGGILLAAGIPIGGGAVYNNIVSHNLAEGNGLAGVTLHNHLANQDLNGNRIVGNRIGTNNLDGDEDFPVPDKQTTGVFVGTAGGQLTITIKHNVIHSNTYGIFLTGPMNTEQIKHNRFFKVTTDIVGP